jgi:hypothetical protein
MRIFQNKHADIIMYPDQLHKESTGQVTTLLQSYTHNKEHTEEADTIMVST